jgi:hypothetical protein
VSFHNGWCHSEIIRALVTVAVKHLQSDLLRFVVAVSDCAFAGWATGCLVVVKPDSRIPRQSIALDLSGGRKKVDELRNFSIERETFDENLNFGVDAR